MGVEKMSFIDSYDSSWLIEKGSFLKDSDRPYLKRTKAYKDLSKLKKVDKKKLIRKIKKQKIHKMKKLERCLKRKVKKTPVPWRRETDEELKQRFHSYFRSLQIISIYL